MEEAIELARAKDTKERMAGVERLYQFLESSRKTLSASETTSLVDCCMDLLKDNNFRVSQGGLQALASAAVLSGENLKLHFNALLPAIVDRLGDPKQPVRDAARRLLLTLMEVSSPTIIVERAGASAWTHKSWRVREEFARTVTAAIGLFASTELPLQRAILPPILRMLNDPNIGVRQAALQCIEEMYSSSGPQFRDEIQRHRLPSSMMKDINARLEKIEPKVRSTNVISASLGIGDIKPLSTNPKKGSPRSKSYLKESVVYGGESDSTEKPVEPYNVYSEKELVREFEKISLTLAPDKDWSVRIAAMQRVEAIVLGGAVNYPIFRGLLKQLVGPLSSQLSDRRSSIVKQACHLLCFLSKELLGDFEAYAEMFISVLLKLVVITVLVIAESADNCIKTMLRNCKVSRALPRIVDSAKSERSAVLRSRCCEYALLVLEHWADAPEIQRSADHYEDLIKCCVADAMSEVRSTARMCYRLFAKTWPDRSRRLFSSFDPAIQRLINEEDGGSHKRHASPFRDRISHVATTPHASAPGYGTSAIVAMDRTSSLPTGSSIPSGLLLSQAKSVSRPSERSLESVLHASKQKVSAIESMLRGLELQDKKNSSIRSSSLDLGVDPPSSRDPPYPASLSASNRLTASFPSEIKPSAFIRSSENKEMGLSDIMSQIQSSKESLKPSYHRSGIIDSFYSSKRSMDDNMDNREAKSYFNSRLDRQLKANYKEASSRDFQSSQIPHFQRPLSRKYISGRSSAKSFDDTQVSIGETSNYVKGPSSLLEALSEGLNPNSDWNARVSALNYLCSLLLQGPKGIQEVNQSFEKVMKLFFQHLDDPHHKVAQAALVALAEIVQSCRKPFESYMERILPHVFSRLIDPKEQVRQPCSVTLDIVGKTYGIDNLLPAMLRSLDEQRSPKAKLAVIEFAINALNRHVPTSEGASNLGILKLWLAKLTPLVREKNLKLKEAAITCIIAVHSHYDPVAVLNHIVMASVEEQNFLRRALKQNTPRIEVDLLNYLQSKKEKQRIKPYDSADVVGSSSEDGYFPTSKKNYMLGRYSGGSLDSDGIRKLNLTHEFALGDSIDYAASDETKDSLSQTFEIGEKGDMPGVKGSDAIYLASGRSAFNYGSLEGLESRTILVDQSGPLVTSNVPSETIPVDKDVASDTEHSYRKLVDCHTSVFVDAAPSIPTLLRLISSGDDGGNIANAIGQLIDASVTNDHSIWSNYFNQILTTTLEVLDDNSSSCRELLLPLMSNMLQNQKSYMEDSVEIVIEKLFHFAKNSASKVSPDFENCINIINSQYDPFRCLSVVVPLSATDDEKTLVACISCLTKLVSRLSQEELMAQLPSFLPSLFEAFGSQSADVRKTVVFCLVDIYILLGKAFLPYLEGLNSTQLRLVTIYANRISQARTGTPIDSLAHS